MVHYRAEARGVPSLLVAKPPSKPIVSIYEAETLNEDEELEGGEEAPVDEEFTVKQEEQDTRGWFEDGTYVATPVASFPLRPPSPHKAALLAWHESFVERFRTLRSLLHGAERQLHSQPLPVSSESTAITNDHPVPRRQEHWLQMLGDTSPTPLYLWTMDLELVLKGLKIVVGLLKIGTDTPLELTRWIFGLLLRCHEVMTRDEVFVLRELGKRAIHIQKKLEQTHCLDGSKGEGMLAEILEDEADEDDLDAEGNKSEGLDFLEQHGGEAVVGISCDGINNVSVKAPAGQHIQSQAAEGQKLGLTVNLTKTVLSSQDSAPEALTSQGNDIPEPEPPEVDDEAVALGRLNKFRKNRKPKNGKYNYVPSPNTLGTLDMIISIVGDVFGQRDLLEERKYHTLGGSWGTV